MIFQKILNFKELIESFNQIKTYNVEIKSTPE